MANPKILEKKQTTIDEIKDKFSGTICRMPNGVFWRF